MKTPINHCIIACTIVLLHFAPNKCFAQVADEPVAPDSLVGENFIDLAAYLPPLSIVTASAIQNATSVTMAEINIRRGEHEVARTQGDWADLVSIQGQYRISKTGIADVVDGQFFPASNDARFGYSVGLQVRIPLSYFTQNDNKSQISRLNVEIMETQKEHAAREVKEAVIETYNQLLLLQRLIQISTEAKEFSDLIFQMSEEKFRDGELSLDQMGANTGLKAKHSAEYERLKTEFSNTYALLERLVGMPLSKLQN